MYKQKQRPQGAAFGILTIMLLGLFTIFQSLSISLGVGASTLAVINFFVAIWDGKIDVNERRMMGVVYIVLRVAMVAIVSTTLGVTLLEYVDTHALSATLQAMLTLIAALYINALLMTYCKMPSSFGPAIQASSWYTLGFMSALQLTDISFSYTQFLLLYLTMLFFAIAIINMILMYCKHCQEQNNICLPQ